MMTCCPLFKKGLNSANIFNSICSSMSEIQSALLTQLELEWLVGKRSNLSKKAERDLRYRINRKLRIFMHTELPLLKNRGFAAALGNDAAISSDSGIGLCPHCTVRSSIAAARVAPLKMGQEPENYDNNKMLRPGFEPGISDSKGRYA
jgi:hypothetical protein